MSTRSDKLMLQRLSFWRWFGRTGLRRLADRWLLLHACVGIAMDLASPSPLSPVASTVLLPVAAILVGLTFAWSGNVAGLLQRDELRDAGSDDGGEKFAVYVFTYQAAILLVLITVLLWTSVAMEIGSRLGAVLPPWTWHGGRVLLFAVSSLTLRECWQGVVGVHAMLLMNAAIGVQKRTPQLPSGGNKPQESPAAHEAGQPETRGQKVR